MKELIEKLIQQKVYAPLGDFAKGHIDGIDEAIRIIQSYPHITAKALRKRGTDEWYIKFQGTWYGSTDVIPYTRECGDIPIDAEEVTVTIIVGEGTP